MEAILFCCCALCCVFWLGGGEWMLLNRRLGRKVRGSRGDSSCGSVVDSHG